MPCTSQLFSRFARNPSIDSWSIVCLYIYGDRCVRIHLGEGYRTILLTLVVLSIPCYSLGLLEVHVFTDSECLGLAWSQLYLLLTFYLEPTRSCLTAKAYLYSNSIGAESTTILRELQTKLISLWLNPCCTIFLMTIISLISL